MGKFTGILLASDMDGTLLGHSGHILPVDRQAISDFIAEGGTFTVATGRTKLSFQIMLPQLEMNAPALLANGALAYDYRDGSTLFDCKLEGNYLEAVQLAAREFPDAGVEIHTADEMKVFRPNDGIRAHIAYVNATAVELDAIEQAPPPWTKVVFVQQPEYLAKIKTFLTERYGDEFSLVSSYALFLEFLHRDANKGAGVARLAENLGIKNVYCIGDEDNDLPMLTRFKSFAPASANPFVKAAAAHIVPDCDSGAVAGAIDWIRNNA